MKNKLKIKNIVLTALVILIIISCIMPIQSPAENVSNKYMCNYKLLTLKTKIETEDEFGKTTNIQGGNILFRKYEDPLIMRDADERLICFANDDYDFITQNNHAIFKDSELLYAMEGKFSFFGNHYTIYDADGNTVAYADFNWLNTKGELYLDDETVVAQYNSNLFRKDYVVTIFENNTMDEDAIQMIFASYVSDSIADSSNND